MYAFIQLTEGCNEIIYETLSSNGFNVESRDFLGKTQILVWNETDFKKIYDYDFVKEVSIVSEKNRSLFRLLGRLDRAEKLENMGAPAVLLNNEYRELKNAIKEYAENHILTNKETKEQKDSFYAAIRGE